MSCLLTYLLTIRHGAVTNVQRTLKSQFSLVHGSENGYFDVNIRDREPGNVKHIRLLAGYNVFNFAMAATWTLYGPFIENTVNLKVLRCFCLNPST